MVNTENKLRGARGEVVGGWVKWVIGIKEGNFWDKHWVSHVKALNHWVLLLEPSLHCILTNLSFF